MGNQTATKSNGSLTGEARRGIIEGINKWKEGATPFANSTPCIIGTSGRHNVVIHLGEDEVSFKVKITTATKGARVDESFVSGGDEEYDAVCKAFDGTVKFSNGSKPGAEKSVHLPSIRSELRQ